MLAVFFAAGLATRSARSEPLRLRGDALAQSRAPVGLLVLRGEDRLQPWIDAEVVAWLAARDEPAHFGDVQTLTVRLRDLEGRGELRAGRFVFTAGAIRPLHVDGVRALGRAGVGTSLEAFAGAPVVARFANDAVDVAAGGRVAQTVGDTTSIGVSYVTRRREGRRVDEEIGADVAFAPGSHVEAAARAAWDLVTPGFADAVSSIAWRPDPDLRFEVFGTHRSAGRILPSTSLFSVLGDIPAQTGGGTVRHRIAPRLDLLATGAAVTTGEEIGGYAIGRATLALDDDWNGTIGAELRRQHVPGGRWTGARALASVPVSHAFRVALEIELVRADALRTEDRTRYWPWALGAISWRGPHGWDLAAGVEVQGRRDDRRDLHALLRAAWSFERSR